MYGEHISVVKAEGSQEFQSSMTAARREWVTVGRAAAIGFRHGRTRVAPSGNGPWSKLSVRKLCLGSPRHVSQAQGRSGPSKWRQGQRAQCSRRKAARRQGVPTKSTRATALSVLRSCRHSSCGFRSLAPPARVAAEHSATTTPTVSLGYNNLSGRVSRSLASGCVTADERPSPQTPGVLPLVRAARRSFLARRRSQHGLSWQKVLLKDPEVILKQVAEYALPRPSPPPDDPAAALEAIGDWNEEWLAVVEDWALVGPMGFKGKPEREGDDG
jgi:hypothetical protein